MLGWGRTNNGQPTNWPDQPHMVDVPIWTNFRCNEPVSYPGQVTDDMVCAGETGKCSCNGEYGERHPPPLTAQLFAPWGGGVHIILITCCAQETPEAL